MEKVWATLRTLGILLALWAILGLVGLIAGVIPWDRSSAGGPTVEPESDAGVDTAALDAGSRDIAAEGADAGAARAEADLEADAPDAEERAPIAEEPDEVEAPGVPALARYVVCPAGQDPSIVAGQLFGDERPELVVGCGDRWEVIAITSDGPARVAVLTAPAAPTGQSHRSGPAAIGDVDGDGAPDLVLPLAFEATQGPTRGGGLFWVPRDGFGGIREPVALAPIAAVDVRVAALDGQSGAEVLALNRGNPVGQVPSDVWVFGGGAAPSRRASVPAGLAGSAIRVGDIDRDGHLDLITLSRDRVGLAFGDGRGAFPRTRTFELRGAREIALGDVDGDGGLDVAVLGDGLRWIRGGAVDAMEPRVVEGAPAGLRGLALVDTNGDGRLDFVGWDHPRLLVLRQEGDAFVPEPALTLTSGPLGPRRLLVLDLDADGAVDDVVLLGTTEDDGPLELVLILDAFGRGDVTTSDTAQPVPNAPVTLSATLPNAG